MFDNGEVSFVDNINGYLLDAPNIFVEKRRKPLLTVPEMVYGNKPTDGGFLFFSEEEKNEAILKEPQIQKYIKRFLGASEFINGQKRYCLWLVNTPPDIIRKSKIISDRVKEVKKFRLNSKKQATLKSAETPYLFQEIRQPSSSYILVPAHTGGTRKYIPIGFECSESICGNANLSIPDAEIYHFGVLTSNVHMAWVKTICGYLGTSFRYSASIVYNNFPWCTPTAEQKAKIEKTAQAILDARALYPDSSLADLYDELTMPPELRKAHQLNDKAVMEAYGFNYKTMTESECVAELMRMYQKLTGK